MTWWVNNQISNGATKIVVSDLPPGRYVKVSAHYWKCTKPNGDRWAYFVDENTLHVHAGTRSDGQHLASQRLRQIMVASVTRDAKTSSPTFNRWYVSIIGASTLRWLEPKEQADFSTLEEAKAWAQAIVGLS